MRYRVDSAQSRVEVLARSSVHNTTTVWTGVTGNVETDPQALDTTRAELRVDMTTADAGDFLKNRKLRKDMELSRYPEASFQLHAVVPKVGGSDGTLNAHVTGTLTWRGRSIEITAQGTGTIDQRSIRAEGTFDLDVTTLGVKPPKILMIKVEDVVSCRVVLECAVDS